MARKILIVDDEPLIVKGLKYSLEQDGYETDSAVDGEEAVNKFFAGQFDLVLLDPPFHTGTLEKILPAVEKCVATGGIVLCESETGIVLPAQAGSLTLQKQYKYGKVLLWKYTKPMQSAAEQEGEAL
mgnify:CR=1 FL=1